MIDSYLFSFKSTGSILSSGLTTVIGFAALILMRFTSGPDMGLAMAKAIFISFGILHDYVVLNGRLDGELICNDFNVYRGINTIKIK